MDIKHEVTFNGPLFYTSGYKYQVAEKLSVFIPDLKKYGTVAIEFAKLANGLLEIDHGFPWDGASGPTIDTESSMRGGCVHDVIYRFIRRGLLPPEAKHIADELLHDICLMDNMWHWRADGWYVAVNRFADSAADPKNRVKIKQAGKF